MTSLNTTVLFVVTAVAEILGCDLPYQWRRRNKSPGLLLPAALSLIVFTDLLTLYLTAAGRVCAASGGVYITVSLIWDWQVAGIRQTAPDFVGVFFCLIGMAGIMFWPRT